MRPGSYDHKRHHQLKMEGRRQEHEQLRVWDFLLVREDGSAISLNASVAISLDICLSSPDAAASKTMITTWAGVAPSSHFKSFAHTSGVTTNCATMRLKGGPRLSALRDCRSPRFPFPLLPLPLLPLLSLLPLSLRMQTRGAVTKAPPFIACCASCDCKRVPQLRLRILGLRNTLHRSLKPLRLRLRCLRELSRGRACRSLLSLRWRSRAWRARERMPRLRLRCLRCFSSSSPLRTAAAAVDVAAS